MMSARQSRPPSAILRNRIVLRSILSSAAAVSAFNSVPYYRIHHVHDSVHRQHNSICSPNQILVIKPNYVPATRPSSSIQNSHTNEATTSTSTSSPLSTSDIHHMKLAAQLARIGSGNTFPNPAVGCVLVRHHDDSPSSTIIGSGFHPKAGMPHAEVFALWEACGHVDDGVDAARSVMGKPLSPLSTKVLDLLQAYQRENGPSELFRNSLSNSNVTAYVTLEPCCHVGRTPPCAASLAAAGVHRVVVGFRDPNPRVDGGGIEFLKRAGIDVRVMRRERSESVGEEEAAAAGECAQLVEYFVKRITSQHGVSSSVYDDMTGKKRMMLRAIALRQKTAGNMPSVEWIPDKNFSVDDNKDDIDLLREIHIDSRFLEAVDQSLWNHELVLLRLNNIVNKKKGAKILGERVAEILCAHVAQVLGHTALLYRPAEPPVLDLDELIGKESSA